MLELPLPDNLLSPLSQSKLMPRFPRPLTSAALDDEQPWHYSAGARLDSVSQAAEGVEDRTIVMVLW